MTERIAAIDCGTNTIKLLIADAGDGVMSPILREMRMVRLGEGVDRTGRLSDEALARTFGAIDEYADLIGQYRVSRIRFCATSATRDSANADQFAVGVERRLGVEPEVLSGDEEAALAFAGAVGRVDEPVDGPVLVLDIGGGSTELILGTGREVTAGHSMDIGSVRLHERHRFGDPPTADQMAACVADVEAALDACPVDPAEAGLVIGVAGTVTTIAAAVLDLAAYDRDLIDQQVLAVQDVHRVVGQLTGMSIEERRSLPFMHPGRADVIDAGALILAQVLRRVSVDSLRASESDILDGIALSLAQ